MEQNRKKKSDKDLSFQDSWLQNTVELAALGTILTGAGTLALKGNVGSFGTDNVKRAIKTTFNGLENYLRRNGSLGMKTGFQIGKKTMFGLRKLPLPSKNEGQEQLMRHLHITAREVRNDPILDKKLRSQVETMLERGTGLSRKENRAIINDALDGTNTFKSVKMGIDERARYLYEQLMNEEVLKRTGQTPLGPKGTKSNRLSGKTEGNNPLNKKQVAQDMIAGGLTGLAFGGGISAMHAIDRMSGDPDAQKNVETAFHYAGSFLPKKEEEGMKKKAGSLEFYNALKQIGRKYPEAIASGLAYTGLSLGTAHMLNKKNEQKKKEDEKPKGARVIIELNEPNEGMAEQGHSALPPRLAGLPRVNYKDLVNKEAAPIENELEKQALKFPSLSQFAKDFKGYGSEIRRLKQSDVADLAAEQLKHEDVAELVRRKYGNLVNDRTEAQFIGKLHDSKANEIKKQIDAQIYDLETREAEARLKALGGGAALTGGGLAGLAFRPKEEER